MFMVDAKAKTVFAYSPTRFIEAEFCVTYNHLDSIQIHIDSIKVAIEDNSAIELYKPVRVEILDAKMDLDIYLDHCTTLGFERELKDLAYDIVDSWFKGEAPTWLQ